MDHFVTTVALVGIVVVVASLLSSGIERAGIPLVAVFLALGALLGPWGLELVNVTLESPTLQVLATLALAVVLFSDAVTIDARAVRAQRRLALRVLGPGTLVPTILIGLGAYFILGLSGLSSAILGAALASTDPVLLRGALRSHAVPPTARIALRLETGMNDAMLLPIVMLAIALSMKSGGGADAAAIGRHLVGLFILGPALGALIGWLGVIALAHVRSNIGLGRDYESLYALGLAFTSYAAAEAVGGSGFLAAFTAGFMIASQDVELCDCFIEFGDASSEMLLLLTFVALGTSLIWTGFTILSVRTLLFAGIALFARTLALYPILAKTGLDKRERKLVALFGPRGLSSLLLTLLPVFAGVPGAGQLFTIACLVVVLSVIIHGGGIGLYIRTKRQAAEAADFSPEAFGRTDWNTRS